MAKQKRTKLRMRLSAVPTNTYIKCIHTYVFTGAHAFSFSHVLLFFSYITLLNISPTRKRVDTRNQSTAMLFSEKEISIINLPPLFPTFFHANS